MTEKEKKDSKNKKGGMTPEQRCYPGELYALHRILIENPFIKEICRKASVSPILFSKHSRTFHWMAVDHKKWQITSEEVIDALKKEIENYQEDKCNKNYDDKKTKGHVCQFKECTSPIVCEWEAYIESMPALEQYKRAAEDIQPKIEKLIKDEEVESESDEDKLSQLHKDLLLLYEGYHLDRFLNLDGIVYRNLEGIHEGNQSEGISWVEGHIIDDKRYCYDYGWLDTEFIGFDKKKLDVPKYQCQEAQMSVDEECKLTLPPEKPFSAGMLFQKALLGLFLPPKESIPHAVFIKPIYDGWIGEKECGALWGNITVLFEDSGEHKHDTCEVTSFINEEKLREFKDICYLIVRELRHAALSIILSQPIKPPYDLIEHFVKHLRVLQDWEQIIVFHKEGKEYIPQCCYEWHKINGGDASDKDTNTPDWEKWQWSTPCNISTDEGSQGKLKDKCANCVKWDDLKKKDEYLFWDKLDPWDKDFIPDITDEERQRYGAIRFAFKYPTTSVIPKEDKDRKDLGETYIRQQLEVLRGLLRKVRARRSALRNAVVSIMGRNMSHNIGSHVLARYATASGEADTKEEMTKEVKQFTRYLQERMDFIADISTTDVFYSLPTRFYGEGMMGFVGDPDDQENKPRQKILLKYISGLAGIGVDIKWEPNSAEDFSFASPGGRLGLQALYVMLENIARNTAKHARGINGEVVLHIHVKFPDKEEFGEYLEVLVWDDLSDVTKMIPDEDKEEKLLPDWINGILRMEMIDDAGSINPNYWGIREIFLAAAYLRSIPLDELESRNTLDAKPPVLEAISHDNGEGKKLGYRFYLEKAHILLEIGVKKTWASDEPSKGVKVIEVSSKDKIIGELKEAAKIGVRHSYGIFPDDEFNNLTLEEKLYLSIMHFENEKSLAKKHSKDGSNQDIVLARAWCEKFIQERVGENNYQLFWTEKGKGEGEGRNGALIFKTKITLYSYSQSELLLFDSHNSYSPKNDIAFYEQFRSAYPQSTMIILDGGKAELYQPLFLQAALTRIIILDERLQAVLSVTDDDAQMPLGDLFKKKGIFIPSEEDVNLDRVKENKDSLLDWLRGKEKDSSCCRPEGKPRFDFIVIHQTIIDKLRDTMDMNQFDKEFQEVAKRLGCEERIIVCSGRGDPRGNLPNYARFIPISGLLECTIHSPSKFHLVNLLNHARRPKRA